jgi:multidrug efflux pump subunit AcrB
VNRAVTSRSSHLLPVFLALSAGILGAVFAWAIPSAVFPELVFPRAIILADSQGLPREQMLVAVTRPLEEAAYGVPGTSLVRSTTTRGSAEIDVTFAEGSDPLAGFQLLNAAVADVRERLPPGTQLNSRLLSTGTFPVLDLSLSSKIRSLPELTDIAMYDLIPALHRIAGVYRADMVGGKYREYVVQLHPAALHAHKLTAQDVVGGLAAANVVASPGRVMDEHRMLLTVASADIHGSEDLKRVPVANVNGQPVRVGDVGQVLLAVKEDYIRAASEHGPAVLVGISRQPDGNIKEIAAQARAIVSDARQHYPDVTFSVSYDQSALVLESFRSVRDAIALGLVLAFAVVLIFTGSPLSAAIALLIVTDCVTATVLVMRAAGLTFNMMTLGGLAAGIGLFIDDAIVMIEGIHTERAAGSAAATAVERASRRLTRPLVAATLTAIVVFLPLATLAGVTGTFFRALAITLGSGLAISLLLALYVTPALELATSRFRSRSTGKGRTIGIVSGAFYAGVSPFVSRRWLAPVVALVALAAAVELYQHLGTDYMPAMDEGAFILDYTTPPESTLPDTQGLLSQIEQILRSTPEVAAFSRRTGTQLGFFLTESNRGDISVRLRSNRRRGIEEIMDSIRQRIQAAAPGVRIEFSQLLQDFLGDLAGTPEPIEVKVFGADQDEIEGTARNIATALQKIQGLVDVFDGVVLSNPEELLVVNTQQAERYKISANDVRGALETVIEGTVATSIRSGDRLIDVRVRYPDPYHLDLTELSKVTLQSPIDGLVPLSSLARWSWGNESPELARERLSPVVRVTARLANIDLGSAVDAVKARLGQIPLPAGVRLEFGGIYAQQQQAFRGLAMVMIAGLFGVFAVLLWEFDSLGAATAVLVASMACLSGGLAGLFVCDLSLNVSSMMGLIMVVGIAAKNGILLLDHIQHRQAQGTSLQAAVSESVQLRIRPILMTVFATAAGMLPLALGLGAGAKIQQPLAVVVIGGLTLSLLVSAPLTVGIYALFRESASNAT